MGALSKRKVAELLHERQRAMAGSRFRPENYHEIPRVLGSRFAPDLNRVFAKHTADAASAYLRRLHRDMDRAHDGYYNKMQASPIQIKRMTIKKEDPRNYRSLLIPKVKRSPYEDLTPSPRGRHNSPIPPLVLQDDSNYVPHKYFSPNSHTHIHVLYKQMPQSVTPRRGGAPSVISGVSHATTDTRYKAPSFKASPRDSIGPSHGGGPISSKMSEVSDPMSVQEDVVIPVTLPRFKPNQASLPPTRKRLTFNDKSLRLESTTQTNFPASKKLEFSPPQNQSDPPKDRKLSQTEPLGQLPPTVAAALAAGCSTSALYRTDLPFSMAHAYDKNLPFERQKPASLTSRGRGLPLPSIPTNSLMGSELLAIVSVQQSNTIQAAA